ncbi:MAG: NAD(P)H-dependent oxidoreductase [Elusimicrobia bacterium]|nr:NAD(P)H-dependent oxidoreductase [Elusimicrobiota bacterium]
MKKLVVFYSLDGNTKFIAENIADEVNADVLELKPRNEPKSKGFMKYLWGGREAMMRTKPELFPLERNPQDYDILFIGTPVWAWTYAPPLNTFFSTGRPSNKKMGLFCCHGGGKGKIFERMKKALSGNTILGEIDFKEPLKHNRDADAGKAKNWAKNLISAL